MGRRLSGNAFDTFIGSFLVHFESMTLDITDNTKPTMTNGVPDGYVRGDVAASGELEVDTKNLNLIMEAAAESGSVQKMDPFDVVSTGDTGDEELKIEAFGCKFRITNLLDLKPNTADKTIHKLPFDVTSKEFVRINDVPYVDAADIENF